MGETRWNIQRWGLLSWEWSAHRRREDGTWLGYSGRRATRGAALAVARKAEARLSAIPDDNWNRPHWLLDLRHGLSETA